MTVPLSTSSSKTALPAVHWGKTWLLALVVAGIVLGSWEWFWRSRGFVPSIADDAGIWYLQRSSISSGTRIVILGASRAQLGLDPDLFEQQTGVQPVNLSIDGNPPFAVLTDLAADPSFHGTVICSMLPRWLAEKSTSESRAEKWVRKYQKHDIQAQVDAFLSMKVQQTVVFRYPGLLPPRLIRQVEKKEWPNPPYAPMRPDRFRPASFTPDNTPKILQDRIRRDREISQASIHVSSAELDLRISAINQDVRQIQARGGQVVFVRMPSSGEIRKIEAATWPRTTYWDRLAKEGAGIDIHFEDFPALNQFTCPDGSHLDQSDAQRFTRELLNILTDRFSLLN